MSALKQKMGAAPGRETTSQRAEIPMRYIAEAIDFYAFLTAISVAICCVPPAVSLFDLPSKLSLSTTHYMTVQRTNSGVSFFGAAVTGALVLTIAHTITLRGDSIAFLLSAAACTCLAGTELIFWLFTYPINVATKQWTVTPNKFETARKQWEYARAISAILTLLALVTVLLSIAAAEPARGA